MSATRTIRSAEGRRVRHPGTGKLLEPGTEVQWSSYWERLLNAGDIQEAVEPAPPVKTPPTAATVKDA